MRFGDPVAQKTTLPPVQHQLAINIARNILHNVLKSPTLTLQSAAMLNYNYNKYKDFTILSQISTYLPIVKTPLAGRI